LPKNQQRLKQYFTHPLETAFSLTKFDLNHVRMIVGIAGYKVFVAMKAERPAIEDNGRLRGPGPELAVSLSAISAELLLN
jgi:hypothetical protein